MHRVPPCIYQRRNSVPSIYRELDLSQRDRGGEKGRQQDTASSPAREKASRLTFKKRERETVKEGRPSTTIHRAISDRRVAFRRGSCGGRASTEPSKAWRCSGTLEAWIRKRKKRLSNHVFRRARTPFDVKEDRWNHVCKEYASAGRERRKED